MYLLFPTLQVVFSVVREGPTFPHFLFLLWLERPCLTAGMQDGAWWALFELICEYSAILLIWLILHRLS